MGGNERLVSSAMGPYTIGESHALPWGYSFLDFWYVWLSFGQPLFLPVWHDGPFEVYRPL